MPKSVDCDELRKLQTQILDCRNRYAEAVELYAKTGDTDTAFKIKALHDEFRYRMDHAKELLGFFSKLERLREEEARKLSIFFEKTIDVPPLPAEITPNRLAKWEQMGFELHYFPAEDMTKDRSLKNWTKKPEDWFYEQITKGNLPPDSTHLPEGWFLVDGRQKPVYTNGSQIYDNDPFARVLEDLNKSGIISQTASAEGTKLNPQSRFGLSPDDFDKPEVIEVLAKAVDLKPDQLLLPDIIVWNLLANIHHPEWGTTNTAEWLKEKRRPGGRLVCGNSDRGGASSVYWGGWSNAFVGFRFLGRFSA